MTKFDLYKAINEKDIPNAKIEITKADFYQITQKIRSMHPSPLDKAIRGGAQFIDIFDKEKHADLDNLYKALYISLLVANKVGSGVFSGRIDELYGKKKPAMGAVFLKSIIEKFEINGEAFVFEIQGAEIIDGKLHANDSAYTSISLSYGKSLAINSKSFHIPDESRSLSDYSLDANLDTSSTNSGDEQDDTCLMGDSV